MRIRITTGAASLLEDEAVIAPGGVGVVAVAVAQDVLQELGAHP